MAIKMQAKFLKGLQERGEIEVKRLTGCIVMSRKEGGYYYLGKSGSLRFGATRQGSIPCSAGFKQILIQK